MLTEYTVLARRYRPQQFVDLVGQEPAAQGLMNAIQTNRVAHAYLFTGARGVGKTSAARILAKALNCAKGPTTTPCDECELCRAIASGDDIDVLEIDGASNRGIDEVREIRQNVQFRPSRARYKVYIIDEVHMLTGPAFNALLKTLEEPPPHVKFIFATTEAGKIPITILSRCQRFDFAGIGTARITERLRQIVKNEGMQADDEALAIVARRAGGSMRDAQSLLDQLLAFGGERLTVEQVHQMLGTANEDRVAALAAAIATPDARASLEQLGAAIEQGLQLGEFLDQIIEYWRDLMVVNCAGLDNQALSVTGKHRESLKAQAEKLNSDTILAGLDILVSAKNRMRYTNHGRVLVELAVVRLCRLDGLVALSQLAEFIGKDNAALASPRGVSGSVAQPVARPSSVEKKKLVDEPVPTSQPIRILFRQENLSTIWQQVIEKVGLIFASELGKASSIAISGPNTLVMTFPQSYNQQGPGYLDPNRVARIEETLAAISGQTCNVRMEFAGAGPEADGAATAVASEAAGPRSRKKRAEIVTQVPLVGKAMDLLGAQIVHMDDDFGNPPETERPEPKE
ncbi:MAG: DNA polymerase III subunit gamma/tau [Planctomycetes bacterium]|nr:DNA polymerase III subunit gamma/tau [Planctomycetota bacterium]